jgi:hypothetical protein
MPPRRAVSDDLGGIEIAGVEDGRRFVAEPPFTIGKRIDGEVQESIKLKGVPRLLAWRWHCAVRL